VNIAGSPGQLAVMLFSFAPGAFTTLAFAGWGYNGEASVAQPVVLALVDQNGTITDQVLWTTTAVYGFDSSAQAVTLALPADTVGIAWGLEATGMGAALDYYWGFALDQPTLYGPGGTVSVSVSVSGLLTVTLAADGPLTVSLPRLSSAALGLAGLQLNTPEQAAAALPAIAAALGQLAADQAQIGAAQDAMQARQTALTTAIQALSGAWSTIRAPDWPSLAMALAREQALSRAGLQALAAAERLPQVVGRVLAL